MDASAPPLIVIVEDDEFAAFLFKQALTSNGYAVAICKGDDESFAALVSQRPAALLVDLHLGEIDGIQLLRRLRAVRSLQQIPAVVITGDYFTDARVSSELESLGIELHLKPIWDDELLRVVAGLIKRPAVAPPPREAHDDRPSVRWNSVTH